MFYTPRSRSVGICLLFSRYAAESPEVFEFVNVLCDMVGHPAFLAHLAMWTGRTGEAFSQARSDDSAGLQPGSPINRINLVFGLLARLVFDRSSCSFTPTCRLVPFFSPSRFLAATKELSLPFPPPSGNAPLPPTRRDHLRPFALISPGLREPYKARFVLAHRTDRPANRAPSSLHRRPLLKLARTMSQRKLSRSRRSSRGPVIYRRS